MTVYDYEKADILYCYSQVCFVLCIIIYYCKLIYTCSLLLSLLYYDHTKCIAINEITHAVTQCTNDGKFELNKLIYQLYISQEQNNDY